MSTADPPPTPTASPSRPPHNRRRRGANRGNPDTRLAQASTAAPLIRPGSVTPAPNPEAPALSNSNRGRGRRGGFGRGGLGRGGRRGGAQGQPMVNGRAFGGQLTSTATSSTRTLDGEALVFVPGRPIVPRARPPAPPRSRRMSKSQAPDIATRTHEDITNGQYECVICTNEVLPNSKIWTCRTCWSVLHLHCVKRWSNNEVSTHQQRATENGELPPPRQWRCPGCNLPKEESPNGLVYSCWCAKEVDPRSVPGLPPHSCGQTCSKKRAGNCPHPCELICHAGPCPPCSHMGPSLSCFCGKEETARRCSETNYESGWSCGRVCGDLLPCGEHTCQRGCHEGLCGSCEVLIESRCYCGKFEKELPCSERDEERESELVRENDETDKWIGSFNCGAECRRPFDCGNEHHSCEIRCHVQDALPAHCPYSPDIVTHCPCGKTQIDTLLSSPRASCSDLIPHCREKCEKLLICGHLCQGICHQGECWPCFEKTQISCRCGRTSSNTICHQGIEEPPSCTRICRSTLNCGRHECGDRCCPGEKKANERQASRRKNRVVPSDENFEAEHICLKVCGRPLKCGNHNCAELCHKGPCRSCREATFEDISCSCGRTVLQPPQPCGMKPPECHFECIRQRTCGHPQVKHQCHTDGEVCPKCPFLVKKSCICKKRTLTNQPCWFTEVRCGLPCGKKLKCGIHFCQKQCHRQGQCEDATSSCTQLCGRNKTVCDHTCADPCHAPYPCKELIPCQAKTFITCECQHQKQAIRCLASKTSEGNSNKALECNEECLKLQRNARLAAALNIDPTTHTDDHIPYSSTTLAMYSENQKFAQTYEREFRVFATDEKEKRLRFKPMQNHQRAFLHALAEDFGLDSESQDPEPHRHVVIFKTPRFVSAPMKTLGQCSKIRAVAPEVPTTKAAAAMMSTNEDYNALLMTNPRFGLTIDELNVEIAEFGAFEISFLPSGDIILKSSSWTKLETLKIGISRKIKGVGLASSVLLCAVDANLNVLRREGEGGSGSGWSQVARGGGSSGSVRTEKSEVGVGGKFTVLGKGKKDLKKKILGEAPEDWEREVEAWDEG